VFATGWDVETREGWVMNTFKIDVDLTFSCIECGNELDGEIRRVSNRGFLSESLSIERCTCQDDSRDDDVHELEEDVSRLTHDIEQLNRENIELKEQVRDLQCEIAQCPI
jgi:predicted RNase H-like nuclease (RuvC/YqgF family)